MPVKVFVGNLTENCSEESINDLFTPYGKLNEVSVLGKFAFVHFENKSDADKAVAELHQKKLFGRNIVVEISKNQGSRGRSGGNFGRYKEQSSFRDRRPNNGYDMSSSRETYQGSSNAAPKRYSASDQNISNSGYIESRNDSNLGNSDYRFENELEADRNVQYNSKNMPRFNINLPDAFIVHEHYYIEPSHPLFAGLYFSHLPHIKDIHLQNNIPQSEQEESRQLYQENVPGRGFHRENMQTPSDNQQRDRYISDSDMTSSSNYDEQRYRHFHRRDNSGHHPRSYEDSDKQSFLNYESKTEYSGGDSRDNYRTDNPLSTRTHYNKRQDEILSSSQYDSEKHYSESYQGVDRHERSPILRRENRSNIREYRSDR